MVTRAEDEGATRRDRVRESALDVPVQLHGHGLSVRIENVNAAAGGRRACIDEHQLCRPSSARRKLWQNDRVRAGTEVNVPVFPAASVLKFAPEKGKPRTAKGEPLSKLRLPTNAGPTVSGNSWSTNLASCLYGSMLTVAVPAVVPSSFLSVMVIAFVVPPGLTITTPKFRLTLFST